MNYSIKPQSKELTDYYRNLLVPLIKKGMSASAIFKKLAPVTGWKTESALYRALIRCGYRATEQVDEITLRYGPRAAKTYRKLLTKYAIDTRFEHLTVRGLPFQKRVGRNDAAQWFIPVTCVCGKTLEVSVCHLRKKKTISCGCARIKRFASLNRTHGCCSHPFLSRLRAVHASMLRRCAHSPRYKNRNIEVCREWRAALPFIIWCLRNNYMLGKVLDRRNNDLGYSPDNCRFVSDVDNANNRQSSRVVEYKGEKKTLAEHCRKLGLHYATVSTRILSYKWSVKKALELPTMEADASCLVYLAWRATDQVLTLGKSLSWAIRKKMLIRAGFKIIGVHEVVDAESAGLLECLFQDWLDQNGVKRGAAPKTKGSIHSHETVFRSDLLKSNFKFHKLCVELLSKRDFIKAELNKKLEELEKELGVRAESVATSKPVPVPTTPTSNICHQRLIRDQTKDEDLVRLQPLLGDLTALKASQFDLALETYAQCHRDFIKRYEWLGTPGISIKWCYAARYKNELGGVVLLSEPYYPSADTALIARGACAGWTPKNLASRMIMFACRNMAENTPKRRFVAYADLEAREVGQVYQSCNFKFLGWKDTFYGVDAEGKRRSFQSFKRTSRMVPWLAEQGIMLPSDCFTDKGYLRWGNIPPDIKAHMRQHIAAEKSALEAQSVRRGKYLLILGPTPSETRKLNRDFKGEVFPYPKRDALFSSVDGTTEIKPLAPIETSPVISFSQARPDSFGRIAALADQFKP